MPVTRGWDCDGGYACLAVEHIEGCFTGEGDPDAAKGLYVAALREQQRGAVEDLLVVDRLLAQADACLGLDDQVSFARSFNAARERLARALGGQSETALGTDEIQDGGGS